MSKRKHEPRTLWDLFKAEARHEEDLEDRLREMGRQLGLAVVEAIERAVHDALLGKAAPAVRKSRAKPPRAPRKRSS